MSLSVSPELIPVTLFCNSTYESAFKTTMAHLLIIAIFGTMIHMTVSFMRKRTLFPIRERAPLIAFFQIITHLLMIFALYIVEVSNSLGIVDWQNPANNVTGIPLSRKIFKAFYFANRWNIYLNFGCR